MDAFVLVCSGGRSAIIPHQFSGSPVVLPSACFFFFPLVLFHCVAWRPLVFSRRSPQLSLGIVETQRIAPSTRIRARAAVSDLCLALSCPNPKSKIKSKSKSISQTSQIPASASTSTPRHTPTDLPASVVSGPPRHIWTDVIRNLPRRAPLLL